MLDELINGDGGGVSWAFQIALVYAVRNELDASFRWLDRSYELRDTGAVLIKSVSAFENIRSDPRYEAFLKKMGLTP